jgi:hypothetical protein
MNANDAQQVPTHYLSSHIHWDYVIRALDNRYLEGNITKYVVRHRKKAGMRDLEKALHYADKLIESVEEGLVVPILAPLGYEISTFAAANGLNSYETYIVKRMANWENSMHIKEARTAIRILMDEQRQRDAEKEQHQKTGLTFKDAVEAEAGSEYVNQDR